MSVEIKNKKASYRYELLDSFSAGIQLTGTEIKSIRNGKASILEAFCKLKKGELFLVNSYIAPYENGGYVNHPPKRVRKLLLNRTELSKLERKTKDVGLTIIPTLLFINKEGKAKVKISLARGKKNHDKRHDLKEKQQKREVARETNRR